MTRQFVDGRRGLRTVCLFWLIAAFAAPRAFSADQPLDFQRAAARAAQDLRLPRWRPKRHKPASVERKKVKDFQRRPPEELTDSWLERLDLRRLPSELPADGRGAGGDTDCERCQVGTVTCGSPAKGALTPDDCVGGQSVVDTWAFALEESRQVEIVLSSEGFDGIVAVSGPQCEAVIAVGAECATDPSASCVSVGLPSGDYFLFVVGPDAGDLGSYELRVDCSEITLCRDCQVGSIACDQQRDAKFPSPKSCELGGFHVDTWSFELEEDRLVNVAVNSPNFDTTVALLDEGCLEIRGNDDCPGQGTNSCLVEQLPAGSYSVRVSSFAPEERGSYDLSVRCQDFDLCGDCVVDSIVCGDTRAAAFPIRDCLLPGRGATIDLVRLEFPQGGPLLVDLASDSFDPFLFLYDEDCQLLDSNDDCNVGLNSCLDADLTPGTYLLGVSSFGTGERGNYSMSVECPDLGPCRDCSVGTLVCGAPETGEISATSCLRDDGTRLEMWQLDIEAPVSRVSLSLTSDDFDTTLIVLDRLCQTVAENDNSDANTSNSSLDLFLEAGTYFVGAVDSRATLGTYRLEAQCALLDPCTDCVTGSLDCSDTFSGELTATDCPFGDDTVFDFWSFSLTEPQQVDIVMTSTDFDTLVILFDADCNPLIGNDGCQDDTNSCLSVPLDVGTYFIAANSFSPATGSYTIELSCQEITFCRDCLVGSVACDSAVSGRLPTAGCNFPDGRAVDLYEFSLPVTDSVRVSLSSDQFDTFLLLYDGSTCLPIAANDDCMKFNSCLEETIVAGTYFLGVTSFSSGQTGTYQLEVECPAFDICRSCVVDDLSGEETARGSFPKSGCQRDGGVALDVWTFGITAETDVVLEVRSDDFDPTLFLYDDRCSLLESNDDCRGITLDSCLDLNLIPGDYFVGVSSVFSGERGNYVLSARRADGTGSQLPGDCNQDGMHHSSDAVCLLNYLFVARGPEFPCGNGELGETGNMVIMDANVDRQVNVSDAVTILRYFFGAGSVMSEADCAAAEGCPAVCQP